MSDRFGTTALLHKEIANMANEEKRHCRIGKVTAKKPEPTIDPLQGWQWTQKTGDVWWVLPHYPNFAERG